MHILILRWSAICYVYLYFCFQLIWWNAVLVFLQHFTYFSFTMKRYKYGVRIILLKKGSNENSKNSILKLKIQIIPIIELKSFKVLKF